MFLPIITNNIWFYLLCPPVINSKPHKVSATSQLGIPSVVCYIVYQRLRKDIVYTLYRGGGGGGGAAIYLHTIF